MLILIDFNGEVREHINLTLDLDRKPPFAVAALFPQIHREVLIVLYTGEVETFSRGAYLTVDQIRLFVFDGNYIGELSVLILSVVMRPKSLHVKKLP